MRRYIGVTILAVLFVASFVLAASPAWAQRTDACGPASSPVQNGDYFICVEDPVDPETTTTLVATTTTKLPVPPTVGAEHEEPVLEGQGFNDRAEYPEELPFTGVSLFVVLVAGSLLVVGLVILAVTLQRAKH